MFDDRFISNTELLFKAVDVMFHGNMTDDIHSLNTSRAKDSVRQLKEIIEWTTQLPPSNSDTIAKLLPNMRKLLGMPLQSDPLQFPYWE